MKIAVILAHVDSGHMALPQFQRGYVWNRNQVRELFRSLYLRHPVGGLLIWNTESETADKRGEGPTIPGMVDLLLDGQQRITSIYGVVRGRAPEFFEGDAKAFTGLQFHLGNETFEFFQKSKMHADPLWIDVSSLMQNGAETLYEDLMGDLDFSTYVARLSRLKDINEIEFAIEQITGPDKTLDVVVDIFNRVNSGGTKLSKGDLTLSKISAGWPEARDTMNANLEQWRSHGYEFDLDWLLRSITTVLTGRAQFDGLQDKSSEEVRDGLERAAKQVNACLNLIAGRLGLDHDRVLFGRYAVPVMARFLDQKGPLNAAEGDKMLYWYIQAAMWGRFSNSTEATISQDLATLENGGMDSLLEQLQLWRGGFGIQPDHFKGWSMGARFYPVLYMLTRTREALDMGSGLALKKSLLGKLSRLEMHHIFPKSLLYARQFRKSEVNALANFCFLTQDTNLKISNRKPESYLAEVEENNPGVLASQWIPQDPALWKIDGYLDFLEARRNLLAQAANELLNDLLPQKEQLTPGSIEVVELDSSEPVGGISSEEEAYLLESLNKWVTEQGIPKGRISYYYDYFSEEKGTRPAIFDLAWPIGLQAGLSDPLVVLLNEPDEVLQIASAAGFRCFTSEVAFKEYVLTEVLGEVSEAASPRVLSDILV